MGGNRDSCMVSEADGAGGGVGGGSGGMGRGAWSVWLQQEQKGGQLWGGSRDKSRGLWGGNRVGSSDSLPRFGTLHSSRSCVRPSMRLLVRLFMRLSCLFGWEAKHLTLLCASLLLTGGSLLPYELDESRGWAMDIGALKAAVAKARGEGKCVRGLVFINPGNPTGQCLSYDNLKVRQPLCVCGGV